MAGYLSKMAATMVGPIIKVTNGVVSVPWAPIENNAK